MAKKNSRPSLAQFLSGLDSSGKEDPTLQDTDYKSLVADLTKAKDVAGSDLGGGQLNIKGATPKQNSQVAAALKAGYSPDEIVKQILGKSPTPSATTTSQTDALAAVKKYLTSMAGEGAVAMGQVGQELAGQNAAVTSTVDQFLTGTPSGNPAVDAAQAAYAKAYSAGEGLNSAAYANQGMANQQYVQQSPYYPIANLLTQGFGSTQYKELPASVVQALPPQVQAALAQAGVTEATSAGGSGTPITVPKGANTAGSANISQILGLTSAATNPNINPNLAPGNPNVPGQ